MSTPEVVLIAAVARNGVIGGGNALLWQLPEDARHFRTATTGHPVIMGRKTWDSLPARFRPLPGRRNIVLTRQAAWHAEGAEVVASLDAALALVHDAAPVFIIGGAQIYAAALPLADELLLTEIDHDYEGDAHFPAFSHTDFTEVARRPASEAPSSGPGYHFVTYRRRAAAA
jgi:dihydrofolate reductase